MVVLSGKWRDRPVTISVKHKCLTVSIEQRGDEPDVYSYDYAGRLWTAQMGHKTYRRGLDGKTVAKWVLPERALRFSPTGGMPHISRYGIREFVD